MAAPKLSCIGPAAVEDHDGSEDADFCADDNDDDNDAEENASGSSAANGDTRSDRHVTQSLPLFKPMSNKRTIRVQI
jgi:hypothetical protein